MLNEASLRDISGGTFYNVGHDAHIYNSTNSSVNRLEHLHKFIAASAFHDSNERHPPPRCHPSTRERIRQKILHWITEDSSTRILWLSGATGTGKSAIAQTIAEQCKKDGLLAAAFFFFRSSPERSPATRLIATIAYQIALFVPGADSFVTKAVDDDLSIFSKDLNTQISHLVVRPLIHAAREQTSRSYFLVIIDGLDECVDEKAQSDILGAIYSAFATKDLPLRFLVTSRPEHQIRIRFERDDLHALTEHLVLGDDSEARQDTNILFRAEFARICKEHHISNASWPPAGVIELLVDKASSQFIYASTVIKFIDDRRSQPQKRLKLILGTTSHGTSSPFAEVDALYTQILDNVSSKDKTLLYLNIIVFSSDDHRWKFLCHPHCLTQLLQLDSGEVHLLLEDLHSVLDVPGQSEGRRFSIHHKSFADFLSSELRSGTYFLDQDYIKAEIARLFWATLREWLDKFRDLDSEQEEPAPLSVAEYIALTQWKSLLPEGRYAIQILEELSNIADLATKKSFDIQLAFGLPFGGGWSDFYAHLIYWLVDEKLHDKHSKLYREYRTLFDKTLLSYLNSKDINFISPMRTIHFLLFKDIELGHLRHTFACLGFYSHIEIFDDFFSDRGRSGDYYLSPWDRADIVVLMIQYSEPLHRNELFRRIFSDEVRERLEQEFGGPRIAHDIPRAPIDIHLSHASLSAATLINLLRQHNPSTFPWKGDDKVNRALVRYILDNSRSYELFLEGERWLRTKHNVVSFLFGLTYLAVVGLKTSAIIVTISVYLLFRYILSPYLLR